MREISKYHDYPQFKLTRKASYVILGAGVAGLTTALELRARDLSCHITVVAKYLPGDRSVEYCSPWAGANWLSAATDNGRQEMWDAVTFKKFELLSTSSPEAGVTRMGIRALFDNPIEKAGILSQGTGKVWYEELVGGLVPVQDTELPAGAQFGYDLSTFMINVQAYLPWLQVEVNKAAIDMQRGYFSDIQDLFRKFPSTTAFINCSGLGSYSLKGVQDHKLYPTRGQVLLIETPKEPITQMYFRSPQRTDSDTTYIFPRKTHGGIVLGGCRFDHEWNGEVDLDFAEDIKRRCTALCPALGSPEDLKVISHNVGLRPSRIGGARVEREIICGHIVIHNYGAGGAGYQSSW